MIGTWLVPFGDSSTLFEYTYISEIQFIDGRNFGVYSYFDVIS